MTLEQIRIRQEQINGLLYTLLNDTMVVVERIVGEQPKPENDSIGYPLSGLLDEIEVSQNTTESYIQMLSEYNKLLCNGTFAPVTAECAAVRPTY